jgi:BTB/POZ domain
MHAARELADDQVDGQRPHPVCTFLQDRKFYAHRIALLASSECFRAMFDGHYKEKQASVIPIPNIRFCVFERMMRCIYTGVRLAPCDFVESNHLVFGMQKQFVCALCCPPTQSSERIRPSYQAQDVDGCPVGSRFNKDCKFMSTFYFYPAGKVEVPGDIAEELLQAADQYMLEGLKRLCEVAIARTLSVDSLPAAQEVCEHLHNMTVPRQMHLANICHDSASGYSSPCCLH